MDAFTTFAARSGSESTSVLSAIKEIYPCLFFVGAGSHGDISQFYVKTKRSLIECHYEKRTKCNKNMMVNKKA